MYRSMHGSLYVCASVYRCIGLCMEVYMYVRVFIGVCTCFMYVLISKV